MNPLLVDVRTARHTLGIGKTTLYNLLKNQKLECRKIGRKTLVTVSSIDALVNGSAPSVEEGE